VPGHHREEIVEVREIAAGLRPVARRCFLHDAQARLAREELARVLEK
jgi:hypothetical protein